MLGTRYSARLALVAAAALAGCQSNRSDTVSEVLCFMPDTKDGKPHLAHGMMKRIKVG